MIRRVLAVASFTLLEGTRTRIVWLALIILAACIGIAEFASALAVTESRAYRIGMLCGSLRLGSVFLLAVFIVASMVRELQGHAIDLYLSRPLSRTAYFIGRLAGYAGLATVTVLVIWIVLAIYTAPVPAAIWVLSLYGELLLVTVFSLTCVMSFSQVPAALGAVTAFYLAGRAIGAIHLMSSGPLVDTANLFQQFIAWFVNALAFVLPELWRYTDAAWVIYDSGQWSLLIPVVMQTVIYSILLAAIGLFDLYRKQL